MEATEIVALSETSTVGPAGVELVTLTGIVLAGCNTLSEPIDTEPEFGVVTVALVGGGATDVPPPEHPGREMAHSAAENATPASAEDEILTEVLLSKGQKAGRY